MSGEPGALTAALGALADQIARRVVELQAKQASQETGQSSPWMGVEKTASYLDLPKQRIYRLTASGAIPHFKQDGRLLFRRDELDAWLTTYAQGERPALERESELC